MRYDTNTQKEISDKYTNKQTDKWTHKKQQLIDKQLIKHSKNKQLTTNTHKHTNKQTDKYTNRQTINQAIHQKTSTVSLAAFKN